MIIHRGNCQIDHWMNWLLIGYMGTMIVLFSQFYIKRYLYLLDFFFLFYRTGPTEEKPKSA